MVNDEEVAVSMRNINAYSSLAAHYGEATVERVFEAKHLHVRGHASGGGGDGMNEANRHVDN